MAEAYRLRIDIPKLRANLSAAEGIDLTDADVREALGEADFIDNGDGTWTAEEISLAFLDASEIAEMKQIV